MDRKIIVVSGINLFTGGTLKVMRECLDALSGFLAPGFLIVALVHDKSLYPDYDNVEYIDYPLSRKNWLLRLYYEYFAFSRLSHRLKPACWISMHDTTPSVRADKRIVYCHNPFPFYRPGWKNFHLQLPIFMLSVFSKYIYRLNIKHNDWVIVQQEWIRRAFKKMYGIPRIAVALPLKESQKDSKVLKNFPDLKSVKKTTFFFPAGAMIHKNFEVLCQATALLGSTRVSDDFKIIITLSGGENRYSRHLYKKYRSVKGLLFSGYLNARQMEETYRQCDCLVFPSKVETWGLPVSEAKEKGIPVLVSDLPWAHETVGLYDKAKFFDPDDAVGLCGLMNAFLDNRICWDATGKVDYESPVVNNWNELLELIIKD